MAATQRRKVGSTGNRLLDRLPPADRGTLKSKMESIQLVFRQVIFKEDDHLEHLYFPVTAVLSLSLPASHVPRRGLELGSVGNEGMAGFTALLGVPTSFYDAVCEVPGECLRLPVPFLIEAMNQRPEIDGLFKKYVALAYRATVQSVICNTFHRVEQRISRWLLVMFEKAAGEFHATQDSLAARLGVKRPTISLIANSLLKGGAISYHRGTVRILDHTKLQDAACDCFKITKDVYKRIIES